jgi:hypothetical protein
MPLKAILFASLTAISTVEPVEKHTPSKPSITIMVLHGPSGPRWTFEETVTVIVLFAPGQGVLCPIFETKKLAGSGESTDEPISFTWTKASIPHTPKKRISITDGTEDAET